MIFFTQLECEICGCLYELTTEYTHVRYCKRCAEAIQQYVDSVESEENTHNLVIDGVE